MPAPRLNAAQPMPENVSGDPVAAFLAGANLPGLPPGIDKDAAMHSLGMANRALAGTLMRLLAARRAIKGEFRISQTVIGARENNPVKFSADEAEVMLALMGIARPGFVSGAPAAVDACRDLEAHQYALLMAFQTVIRHLFDQLKPEAIANQSGAGGDKGFLARMRSSAKAEAWDAYQRVYADLARDFQNNLTGRLGQMFAESYEAESRNRGARD